MKRAGLILAAIIVVTLARVATTHRVFSGTIDEPGHVAAAYDWWVGLPYTIDISHPPLARILFGLPVRLDNPTPPKAEERAQRGDELLGDVRVYRNRLQHARLANLPLLALGLWAVYSWTRRRFSTTVALTATALYATLPPLLAHAGLVTTDLAVAATFPLAIDALTRWLDAPSQRTAAWLGVAVGLGLLAKYSFVVFFPAAVVVVLIAHRPRAATAIGIAVAIAVFLVWAGYRFSFGTIANADATAAQIVQPRWVAHVPMPAPLFVLGAYDIAGQNNGGHWAYLFGETNQTGWWYYFPVVLLYKTPLPFLILWLIGTVILLLRRETIDIALIPLLLLAISMTSHINLGVRHLLPLYAPMAIAAAVAADALWRRGRVPQVAVAGVVAWQLIGTTAAHPDYLPWFNELAGKHPERILVDSNLDWGQDFYRLARVTRKEHVHVIGQAIFHTCDLHQSGLPDSFDIQLTEPSRGWIAISDTVWSTMGGQSSQAYSWARPMSDREMRVGKTITLFHIP